MIEAPIDSSGGGGGHGPDDETRVAPEVRNVLDDCGIGSVLHLWAGILTGEAAIEFVEGFDG